MDLTLTEWQDRIWKQQVENFQSHNTEAKYYFLFRTMSELGELANVVNKQAVYGNPVNIGELWNEFGDVLYFLMLAACKEGVNLNTCLEQVRDRVQRRIKQRAYGRAQLEAPTEA